MIKINDDLAYSFSDWLLNNKIKYKTRIDYRKVVLKLVSVSNGKLTNQKIWGYISERNYPLSHIAIKKFLEYLKIEKGESLIVVRFPALPLSVKKIYQPLTIEETNKIINGVPNKHLIFRFKLAVEFISYGFSQKQATQLKKKHLLIEDNRIVLLVNDYEKVVFVPEELMQKLKNHCENKSLEDYVFDFGYKKTMRRYNNKRKKNLEMGLNYYDKSVWPLKYYDKTIKNLLKVVSKTSLEVIGRSINCNDLKKSPNSKLIKNDFLVMV